MASDMDSEHCCLWIFGTHHQATVVFTTTARNTCARSFQSTSAAGHPRGLERTVTFRPVGCEKAAERRASSPPGRRIEPNGHRMPAI
jgi:hypothetical protein